MSSKRDIGERETHTNANSTEKMGNIDAKETNVNVITEVKKDTSVHLKSSSSNHNTNSNIRPRKKMAAPSIPGSLPLKIDTDIGNNSNNDNSQAKSEQKIVDGNKKEQMLRKKEANIEGNTVRELHRKDDAFETRLSGEIFENLEPQIPKKSTAKKHNSPAATTTTASKLVSNSPIASKEEHRQNSPLAKGVRFSTFEKGQTSASIAIVEKRPDKDAVEQQGGKRERKNSGSQAPEDSKLPRSQDQKLSRSPSCHFTLGDPEDDWAGSMAETDKRVRQSLKKEEDHCDKETDKRVKETLKKEENQDVKSLKARAENLLQQGSDLQSLRLEKQVLDNEVDKARAKLEKEKLEKQKLKKEKQDKDKFDKEKLDKEKLEKEKLDNEKLDKEKLDKEKLVKEVAKTTAKKEMEKQEEEYLRTKAEKEKKEEEEMALLEERLAKLRS